MNHTVYLCDRCSHEVDEDRHVITLVAGPTLPRRPLELCTKCVADFFRWAGTPPEDVELVSGPDWVGPPPVTLPPRGAN